ncbi:MAG: hypothetical protein ACRDST_14750 [Pseudonocardiaceae bacterium]
MSRYQLCRWEKGTREPTLEGVRRVLGEFGLAVTFGVEPHRRPRRATEAGQRRDRVGRLATGEPRGGARAGGGRAYGRRRGIRGGPAGRPDRGSRDGAAPAADRSRRIRPGGSDRPVHAGRPRAILGHA